MMHKLAICLAYFCSAAAAPVPSEILQSIGDFVQQPAVQEVALAGAGVAALKTVGHVAANQVDNEIVGAALSGASDAAARHVGIDYLSEKVKNKVTEVVPGADGRAIDIAEKAAKRASNQKAVQDLVATAATKTLNRPVPQAIVTEGSNAVLKSVNAQRLAADINSEGQAPWAQGAAAAAPYASSGIAAMKVIDVAAAQLTTNSGPAATATVNTVANVAKAAVGIGAAATYVSGALRGSDSSPSASPSAPPAAL